MEFLALNFRCQCTQQKLQSISAVSTLKILNIFCKRQISITYVNYLICIKDFNAETNTSLKLNLFSFFICGCQHHQRKTICLYEYISDIRQLLGYRTPVFIQRFPWRLHFTITYNLPHLRLWYADVVTVIAYTPEVTCRFVQTSRQEKDGTWSELTWFETTVLDTYETINYKRKNESNINSDAKYYTGKFHKYILIIEHLR